MRNQQILATVGDGDSKIYIIKGKPYKDVEPLLGNDIFPENTDRTLRKGPFHFLASPMKHGVEVKFAHDVIDPAAEISIETKRRASKKYSLPLIPKSADHHISAEIESNYVNSEKDVTIGSNYIDDYEDFMNGNDVDLFLAKNDIENVNKCLEIFFKQNSDEVSQNLFNYDKD